MYVIITSSKRCRHRGISPASIVDDDDDDDDDDDERKSSLVTYYIVAEKTDRPN